MWKMFAIEDIIQISKYFYNKSIVQKLMLKIYF